MAKAEKLFKMSRNREVNQMTAIQGGSAVSSSVPVLSLGRLSLTTANDTAMAASRGTFRNPLSGARLGGSARLGSARSTPVLPRRTMQTKERRDRSNAAASRAPLLSVRVYAPLPSAPSAGSGSAMDPM